MAVFDFLALASDGLICCPPTTIMFSPSAMLPALFVLRVFAFAAPAHEPSRQSSPCHCSSTPLPVDPPCCFLLPPPAAPSCCPLLVELESINCCSPPMSLPTPASLSHSHMHLLFSHFRHCPTLLSHFPVQETIIYFIKSNKYRMRHLLFGHFREEGGSAVRARAGINKSAMQHSKQSMNTRGPLVGLSHMKLFNCTQGHCHWMCRRY